MEGTLFNYSFRELISLIIVGSLGVGGLLATICGLQWMHDDKYSNK